MARYLRAAESVIDEETERAVESWVRLGDQLSGARRGDERATCAHCGSRYRVMARGDRTICVRCYLESGDATLVKGGLDSTK